MIVYPEEDDADKPKVFARQSFVVSGEEEEMAETILRARELGAVTNLNPGGLDSKPKDIAFDRVLCHTST